MARRKIRIGSRKKKRSERGLLRVQAQRNGPVKLRKLAPKIVSTGNHNAVGKNSTLVVNIVNTIEKQDDDPAMPVIEFVKLNDQCPTLPKCSGGNKFNSVVFRSMFNRQQCEHQFFRF